MATTTPNIGLTLPTGAENVSRQIINDNNTKIDTAIGTLNSNLTPIADRFQIIKVNSGLPKDIGVGGYGSFLVLGFAQGIGGVAIAVNKSSTTVSAFDITTGTAWTNNKLTFTASGTTEVTIASAQAGDSILTIIKGSV